MSTLILESNGLHNPAGLERAVHGLQYSSWTTAKTRPAAHPAVLHQQHDIQHVESEKHTQQAFSSFNCSNHKVQQQGVQFQRPSLAATFTRPEEKEEHKEDGVMTGEEATTARKFKSFIG
ncbi:hypothetical protein LR48_Vigan11g026400 [Vigna angularis]|uniref:Uncharacterized protein n=1 Tax=Phaseolus angularis TaxID=3914 RepID=A0A0L9VQT2_PHAAN|nr:hypothetical protein LR48_Vigan11g026400 [Vigna angularis]